MSDVSSPFLFSLEVVISAAGVGDDDAIAWTGKFHAVFFLRVGHLITAPQLPGVDDFRPFRKKVLGPRCDFVMLWQ